MEAMSVAPPRWIVSARSLYWRGDIPMILAIPHPLLVRGMAAVRATGNLDVRGPSQDGRRTAITENGGAPW